MPGGQQGLPPGKVPLFLPHSQGSGGNVMHSRPGPGHPHRGERSREWPAVWSAGRSEDATHSGLPCL